MAVLTINTKFYPFFQNNSGGRIEHDEMKGIGDIVWIEATDHDHANSIAESLGISFDSVDCECCGPRWRRNHHYDKEDWVDEIEDIPSRSTSRWHAYVHRLKVGGSFIKLT